MRRGDVVIVDLGPARGSEARDRRPAVVVSNDGANSGATARGRGDITIVPLTSNVARIYPFQVALAAQDTGLSRNSKAQIEQVRAVDVGRVERSVGQLPTALVEALDERLRLHLAL